MKAYAFILLGSIVAIPGYGQESLTDWVARHEGFSERLYLCPAGKPTIGFGHRLLPGDRLDYPLTPAEGMRLLLADLQTAQTHAQNVYPDIEQYPTGVKFVLTALAFQVGQKGLSKFVKMGAAIRTRSWGVAAMDLRDSVLMKQCPRRTEELATILETATE